LGTSLPFAREFRATADEVWASVSYISSGQFTLEWSAICEGTGPVDNVNLVLIIGLLNLQVGFVVGICHRRGFSISDNSMRFLREQLANLIPKRGPSHTTDTIPEEGTQRVDVPAVPETKLNEAARSEEPEPPAEPQSSGDSGASISAAEIAEDNVSSEVVPREAEEVAGETESPTVADETPKMSEDKLPQEIG